ncbi:hypothetical protein BZA77DRAFT_297483 [Pyronema omphalodes]|nr:hypothetical protein BZA77DRAFT_297483 [Pyronema omphalodes]
MSSARNSSSELQASNGGSLRPPNSRPGHHLRASADMSGAFQNPLGGRIRPSSEIFLNPPQIPQETEGLDKAAREWMNDLESYENTLEEMASAALDQEFKDELSAIEQWFRVLSEAERTAALYALLQQTTQVQIRFFIQVLQQMAKSHPMLNLLSPNTFEKDAMTNRMNDAMSKLTMGSRESFNNRPPPPSPGGPNSRNAGVEATSMFPEAAAAIAAHRAKISAQGGPASGIKSNRNSALFETRSSSSNLNPASISNAANNKENNPPPSPWNRPSESNNSNNNSSNNETSRPKSASGQPPMGNFQLPQVPAGGLRSPRNPPPQITGDSNIRATTLSAPSDTIDLAQLSPYAAHSSGNWASMVNTPVNAMFPQGSQNADMIANATAMKLAALSTVNNRIILDNDPKGWGKRRKDSTPGNGAPLASPRGMPGLSPAHITMYNEHGQLVTIPTAAAAALQSASPNHLLGGRSRPSSPGIFNPAAQWGQMGFASPQAGGFLAAQSPLLNNGLLGQFGSLGGSEGYISDDVSGRGRSPRGRRGSSKPPEDPTNPELLNDIPSWLRSLRLHKYTDNLKDLNWQDLVQLDDEALDKRGVNALGARRKMLKVFEQVRQAQSEGKI